VKNLFRRIRALEERLRLGRTDARAEIQSTIKRLWEERIRETARLPRSACVWLPQYEEPE
jgi:hypothetical protein